MRSKLSKATDLFSRFFVGGLFVFSGLIKLNDPIGTEIKMEEYFTVFADSFAHFFELLVPFSLPIAFFLIVFEIALGVAVLIQFRMRFTTAYLLGLMIFFTGLTFFSAYTGKVTDCGCFGDAIPLTPWESFYKDVILMVFVLHLFWYRKRLKPSFPKATGKVILLLTILVACVVGWNAIAHLPYIDFRPYSIGSSIPEQMLPEEEPIIEYVFEKNGDEIVSEKYLSENEGYTYKDSRIVNEKASTPKITDYQVVDDEGNDVTQETLEGRVLLLVFQNISTADLENMDEFRELADGIKNTRVMAITASGADQFERLRHQYQLAVPYYFVDATVLKAMIRSNPGIMLLQDGRVLGKWHENDVPEPGKINEQ